jgi:hypothetical protein
MATVGSFTFGLERFKIHYNIFKCEKNTLRSRERREEREGWEYRGKGIGRAVF